MFCFHTVPLLFFFLAQELNGQNSIRQGAVVQLVPGRSGGCLSSATARGRVIATNDSSRPYLVRPLEGGNEHWYSRNELMISVADVATTPIQATVVSFTMHEMTLVARN